MLAAGVVATYTLTKIGAPVPGPDSITNQQATSMPNWQYNRFLPQYHVDLERQDRQPYRQSLRRPGALYGTALWPQIPASPSVLSPAAAVRRRAD